MKITIIGGGNMGGAIARGMAKGTIVNASDITVADKSTDVLAAISTFDGRIQTTTDNQSALLGADIVVLAVKPWLMKPVVESLTLLPTQIVISIAAGTTLTQLADLTCPTQPLYRLVPNIAISQMESMTLMATRMTTDEQDRLVYSIFSEMGAAMFIQENQVEAVTALTSCGIAFVLKYIQAAAQAGVEMGLYPKDAQRMVAQSVKGAATLLLSAPTSHPAVEIDRVTTPGGITIRGLNTLEHEGFTSAIIKAMKASR